MLARVLFSTVFYIEFGEVEYTKILSKLQYDDLDFFYRLKEQKPI